MAFEKKLCMLFVSKEEQLAAKESLIKFFRASQGLSYNKKWVKKTEY